MLLTGKQLAMTLNVHITTIRRACRNEDIPYERLGKLYFFDLDRVRQAMQRNGGDVLKGESREWRDQIQNTGRREANWY